MITSNFCKKGCVHNLQNCYDRDRCYLEAFTIVNVLLNTSIDSDINRVIPIMVQEELN